MVKLSTLYRPRQPLLEHVDWTSTYSSD